MLTGDWRKPVTGQHKYDGVIQIQLIEDALTLNAKAAKSLTGVL